MFYILLILIDVKIMSSCQ